MPVFAPSQPSHAAAAEPAAPSVPEEGSELAIVKSPIVGTFYRSAEPGTKAFVSVGDTVRKGQVLCIIEAMKLMNEIDSEYDGEVMSVYVENGQPVQYGERLFAIRPSS
jgi:acetyl-CoA carboxylase biotin carboxyl carrier protein